MPEWPLLFFYVPKSSAGFYPPSFPGKTLKRHMDLEGIVKVLALIGMQQERSQGTGAHSGFIPFANYKAAF